MHKFLSTTALLILSFVISAGNIKANAYEDNDPHPLISEDRDIHRFGRRGLLYMENSYYAHMIGLSHGLRTLRRQLSDNYLYLRLAPHHMNQVVYKKLTERTLSCQDDYFWGEDPSVAFTVEPKIQEVEKCTRRSWLWGCKKHEKFFLATAQMKLQVSGRFPLYQQEDKPMIDHQLDGIGSNGLIETDLSEYGAYYMNFHLNSYLFEKKFLRNKKQKRKAIQNVQEAASLLMDGIRARMRNVPMCN